ncbi:hypothetical protein OH717_33955 (plasmid) [Streptomyces albidoflavus]|uniref:hypothetical protein n=1 Tax=Streptomyces albidoflavus TaxID=1886 RepID=UPI002F9172C5|nr:hypothetical protein OH717_34125 [Streptomyces albidoflavus]WTD07606.1 hypothetical protein OH717_33955 [Streptomyces albidoflavus]
MTKPSKPSEAVQKLLAEARADYQRANSPAVKAAAREQSVHARIAGNAAAGAPGSRRN